MNAAKTTQRPILFFDSGIGGLTVLREARLYLPESPFLYVVDNAAFPYGAWKEEALREHLLRLFTKLLTQYNPILCVVACNTASTLVLEDLRQAFPQHSFVGTVPAIKPAAEHSFSKQVSVLATVGTVKRAYTHDLVNKYAEECEITLVGSPLLASIAEDHIHDRSVDMEAIKAEIAPCFVEKNGKKTDIVVLACTHYPFLTPLFRNVAPWPVDWLDPAEAIARRAQYILHQKLKLGNYTLSDDECNISVEDYVIFTDSKTEKNFINKRLFHSFGLKIAKS